MAQGEFLGIHQEFKNVRHEIGERFNKVDDDIRYIHSSFDVVHREIMEI